MIRVMAGAIALVLAGTAASAADPLTHGGTMNVRVTDLDLSRAADQRRLDIRLANAAEAVCGVKVAHIHLAMQAKADACKAEAIDAARTEIAARQPGVRLAALN